MLSLLGKKGHVDNGFVSYTIFFFISSTIMPLNKKNIFLIPICIFFLFLLPLCPHAFSVLISSLLHSTLVFIFMPEPTCASSLLIQNSFDSRYLQKSNEVLLTSSKYCRIAKTTTVKQSVSLFS